MRGWALALVAALSVPAAARADDDLGELVGELSGPSDAAREHAISRLSFLGPRRAGPAVLPLLASGSAETRRAAAEALSAMGDREAAPLLAKALGDPDAGVRLAAANALGAMKARSGAGPLGRALAKDADARVRSACATALSKTGGEASALARAAAKDRAIEVRLAALDALAVRMDRSQNARLARLLDDPDGLVRFAAARALAWAGDPRARRFLDRAVQSRDFDDRHRALTVLADCPKGWAAELLAKALADDELALEAAKALGRRGDRRGIAALVRLSQGGKDEEEATQALDVLGIPDDERARLAGGAP